MSIVVKSETALSAVEMKQIADIMQHSQCPHESLKSTFPQYEGMSGNTLFMGGETETAIEF